MFTRGIYDFVVDNIKTEHQKVYKICASGTCTKQNCSKRFNKFKDWCPSCSKWKSELKKLKSTECHHWNVINWSQLSSSDWPQSIYEMAKVFVKNTSINFRQGVFDDFGAVMSILTNMCIFGFDKTTLEDIKRMRNDYYGHRSTNGIHDAEKRIFFDKLLRFIRLPRVFAYQSAITFTPSLVILLTTEHLTQTIVKELLTKDSLNDVRDVLLNNLPGHISNERAIVVQDETTANSQLYSQYKSRLDELISPQELTEESEIVESKPYALKIKCNHLFRFLLVFTLFVILKKPKTDSPGISF